VSIGLGKSKKINNRRIRKFGYIRPIEKQNQLGQVHLSPEYGFVSDLVV
jgi:hypothetical protein